MNNIYEILFYLKYIMIFIYNCSVILHNKYVKKNDIVLYVSKCNKYDKIHDLVIVYYLFNIQIHTYINKNKDYKRIITYQNSNKLSDIIFINNLPIDDKKIQIVLEFIFIDDLDIINKITIYNSGILFHENFFIHHVYNFSALRRNVTNNIT